MSPKAASSSATARRLPQSLLYCPRMSPWISAILPPLDHSPGTQSAKSRTRLQRRSWTLARASRIASVPSRKISAQSLRRSAPSTTTRAQSSVRPQRSTRRCSSLSGPPLRHQSRLHTTPRSRSLALAVWLTSSTLSASLTRCLLAGRRPFWAP